MKNKVKIIIVFVVIVLAAALIIVLNHKSEEPRLNENEIPKVQEETLEELQERIDFPDVVMTDAKAKQGEEVEVTFTVVNNPGILGMTAVLSYDEKEIELISATNGEAFSDVLELTSSKKLGSGCVFLWDGLDIKPDQVSDGAILHLKFKISDSAPVGKYPVVLVLEKDGVVDRELNPINISIEPGYITVY